MANEISKLVKDVVSSPLGDIIASVGEGVAEAQQALDEGSLAKTLEIYSEGGSAALTMLKEIGYQPTFYALPETTGEVTVSLSLGQNPQKASTTSGSSTSGSPSSITPAVLTQLSRTGRNIGLKPRLYATPVDGGYANKYGYQANISAKLSFKIVPVPAPTEVENLRIVPIFETLKAVDAIALADEFEFNLSFIDAAGESIESPEEASIINLQDPKPNTIGRIGDSITLTIT